MISIELNLLKNNRLSLEFRAPITQVGTLYKITAVCYSLGFNIISAKIDTVFDPHKKQWMSSDRFVLNTFRQEDLNLGQTYHKIAQLLDSLILNEISIQQVLKDLYHSSKEDLQTINLKTQWVLDRSATTHITELFIESDRDSPGLLYKICHLFYDLNISIEKAIVKTNAKGKVEDHFYLKEDGQAVKLEKIKMIEKFLEH